MRKKRALISSWEFADVDTNQSESSRIVLDRMRDYVQYMKRG